MLQTLSEILDDEGYVVDSCATGGEAVLYARENNYDLVIADIRMEGLDGLGALSQVQSYQPNVGSLVVTGYASDAQSTRAGRLNLGGLLEKPFDLGSLLDTVDHILGTRREEILRRKREERLLSCSHWSSGWTATLLESQAQFPFRELLRLSRRLAQEMGIDGPRSEEVSQAALWWAAKRNRVSFPEEAPTQLSEHLEGVPELWDGSGPRGLRGKSIPLESRIISAALAACQNSDLRERWPGRFDPIVLDALDRVGDSTAPTEESRSLLEVAQALLNVGDFPSAERALQQLINLEAACPAGVEATLEMARLKQRAGDPVEARRLARLAPEVASHFGPLLQALTGFRSALLLSQLQESDGAVSLLEEARAAFQNLGLELDTARCHLAHINVLQQTIEADSDLASLDLLLAPEYRKELVESLPWLVPLLLRSEHDKTLRALVRVIAQFPGSLVRSISSASLQQRRTALKALALVPAGSAADGLRILSADPEAEIRSEALRLASGASKTPEALPLTLHTLGRFELLKGDIPAPDSAWRSTKVKYVLACLASRQTPVPEDLLLEQFWPGDVTKARKNLNATISYVRSAIRKAGVSEESVVKGPTGLSLNSNLVLWHDVRELRAAITKARKARDSGQLKEATGHYRRAFRLHGGGTYLEGCYLDWAVEVRRELEDAVLEAALHLATTAIEHHRYSETLECAKAALKLDPCLQNAHLMAMRAYLGMGRAPEAVRQYETCKAVLHREFQSVPSVEVERLHQEARLAL